MPKSNKELKDFLMKMTLEKEALEKKMAPMETKLASLQWETKCMAKRKYL